MLGLTLAISLSSPSVSKNFCEVRRHCADFNYFNLNDCFVISLGNCVVKLGMQRYDQMFQSTKCFFKKVFHISPVSNRSCYPYHLWLSILIIAFLQKRTQRYTPVLFCASFFEKKNINPQDARNPKICPAEPDKRLKPRFRQWRGIKLRYGRRRLNKIFFESI